MMRRNCWTAALCLGLMLFGGHRLRADEPERQWAELKAKMEAEGWTEITEGVFERHWGENKVEHLGYGREGLAWHIGELTRQLETMMREHETYPSENLAKIIDNLSVMIARSKRELRNIPEGLSLQTAAIAGPSCSSICYSATADAYPLANVQGVAAVAEAKFNSTCGFSGETYAFAHAKATKNGVTTVVEQEDPKAGTSITSYVAASVEGTSVSGVPCYSTANAYAQSTDRGINIHYSTSDTNDLCPAPPAPLNASITSGPTSVPFTTATCATKTWGATATGGVPSYTYTWYVNDTEVGTGSSYSQSVCYNHAGFTLKVAATDAAGATDNDSRLIDISYTPPSPSVSISGSTSESFSTATCRTVNWGSTISGGISPYTYAWYVNNAPVGTNSSYSRSVCYNDADFTLRVVVMDSNSLTSQDLRTIDVINNVTLPTSVAIAGSTYEKGTCDHITWSAIVSGGSTPYTYKWKKDGLVVSSTSTYTERVCGSHAPGFKLDLSVNGVADPDGHYVTVDEK